MAARLYNAGLTFLQGLGFAGFGILAGLYVVALLAWVTFLPTLGLLWLVGWLR